MTPDMTTLAERLASYPAPRKGEAISHRPFRFRRHQHEYHYHIIGHSFTTTPALNNYYELRFSLSLLTYACPSTLPILFLAIDLTINHTNLFFLFARHRSTQCCSLHLSRDIYPAVHDLSGTTYADLAFSMAVPCLFRSYPPAWAKDTSDQLVYGA